MPPIDANRNASRRAAKKVVRKRKPVPKPKAPSKAVVKRARAQQQQYVSQGKAVKKAAKQQREGVKLGRALERESQYVDQGKQVERTANVQKKALRRKVVLVKPLAGGKARKPSLLDREQVERFAEAKPSEQKQLTKVGITAMQQHRSERKASIAGQLAPALKVLDQTTRPLHAVVAAERSQVKSIKSGKGLDPVKALKAAAKGAANKDKSTASDLLKDVGVKNKTIRAVVGTALDVVGDPTTYVTGGAGSIARREALQAADRVAVKAAGKATAKRAPTTAKEANRAALREAGGGADAPALAERARARKERGGDQTKGVTINVAGHEVPGVRRASAKASKPVRKAARKATPQKVRNAARSLAADVNPNIAPVGVSHADHESATVAIRSARAKANQGTADALKEAHAIRKKIGEKNYATIIDAIESGSLKGLSPDLHKAAVVIRSQLRHANRVRKQAGIRGGERKNYVPRERTPESLAAEGKADGRGSGSKTIKPSYEKQRTETRPMKVLREEEPGKYSEDLASLHLHRMSKGKTDVAKAELNRTLANMGRDVKPGDIKLKEGEGVFHIKGSDIREVTDAKELEDLADGGWTAQRKTLAARLADEGKSQDDIAKALSKLKAKAGGSGRYVILSTDVVKRATEGVNPQLKGGGIVHGFDKVTGGFKTIATATPGFHVRNAVGDTQNHYLYAAGHRVPANLVQAGRVLKAAGRKDKAKRNLDHTPEVGTGTIKTKRYGNVSYDDVATNLARTGAYRSGYTARELPDLLKSGGKVKVRRVRVPDKVKTAALNREDLPRLATAIEALKKGATWEEAASKVAEYHFDYQHLTSFERNIARRGAPFYTFTARNIPLQTKTLVTKPGKYANYEKIREEGAKAAGMGQDDQKTRDLYAQLKKAGVTLPKGWQSRLSEWEQRNAGVPVSWKGHKFTVSLGLPLGDLNEVPGAGGAKQLDEYFQKFMSMSNPLLKDPVEFFSNFSFFFRDQIERENSPLVAAPDVVGTLPAGLRNKLGITKINDKKNPGRKVWAWPAKTDYLAKAVPGTPQYVQQLLTSGTDRRGKSRGGKLLAYSGIKAVPFDPATNAVSLTYDREHEINKQIGKLSQKGINAKHPNAAYTRLKGQLKTIKNIRQAAQLSDPQQAHMLIKASDELATVTAKKAQAKKTDDNFYYTKDYQALLDREKSLRAQINDLTGIKPKKSVRLSRRPLPYDQQIQKRTDERLKKYENYGDYLKRKYGREAARLKIQSGG